MENLYAARLKKEAAGKKELTSKTIPTNTNQKEPSSLVWQAKPPKRVAMTTRIAEDTLDKAKNLCKEKNITFSSFVEQAVVEAIEKYS